MSNKYCRISGMDELHGCVRKRRNGNNDPVPVKHL